MVALSVKTTPELTGALPGPADRRSGQRAVATVFCYFVVLGVATVMLGPVLPLLAARWAMHDAQLGSLFVSYFAGQFCGAWFATPRLRMSLVLGAIFAAFGLALLAFAGAAIAHAALFLAGLGLGAGLTAGNVMMGTLDEYGEVYPAAEERRAPARVRNLALLNIAWGLGAIACPLLLDLSLRQAPMRARSGQLFFAMLAAALGLCTVLLALHLPRTPLHRSVATQTAHAPDFRWPLFALFAATFMLYVGVENALGGWLPTYAERLSTDRLLVGRASAIALCFWACELAGRALMAAATRLRQRFVYRACLAALIVIAAIVALVPHLGTAAVFAVAALAGLSLAPLFPLAVAFLLARTGNHPRVGKVFACASLGGTGLPWLTGVLSGRFQSLRIGFAVPVAGAVLMLMLSFYLPRQDTRGDEVKA